MTREKELKSRGNVISLAMDNARKLACAEVGYFIKKTYWNRGINTKGFKQCAGLE